MRSGHILTIIGVALYLVGALVLPWQHFTLANVDAFSFEVSIFNVLGIALASLVGLSSLSALVTGKRASSAKLNLLLSALAFILLIVSSSTRMGSFSVMQFEEAVLGGGYLAAIWGVIIMVIGGLFVLATLPAWDTSSPFLRVLTMHKGQVVGDQVIYKPGVYPTAESLTGKVADSTRNELPSFKVTREGDCAIAFANSVPSSASVAIGSTSLQANAIGKGFKAFNYGESGTVEMGDTQVHFHFIAPIPGHTAAAGFDRTEVGAFALAASFGFIALALVPIITMSADPVRNPLCGAAAKEAEGGCPGVFAKEVSLEEQVVEVEVKPPEEAVNEVEYDEDVSKKAGGEEGKFGDPNIDPTVESKIPNMDGKMVDRVDPRQIGLTKLLNDSAGGMNAVAEVLKGDVGAMSSKLAVAMGGSGSEFVLGHGSGGMGYSGTGSGGGGDGTGRIMGMGDIDTGGGKGVKAGLGDKGKKRVGNLQMSGSQQQGFCKKSNIESVVKRRAGAIRACYEQRLQVKNNLQGKVVIQWTINTEGGVQGVSSTSDTLGDNDAKQCIIRTIQRMRFEKPEGGICVISWPFVFSPG